MKTMTIQSPMKIQSPNKKENVINVSALITSYLQDGSDKSNAGYSIRYNKDSNNYTVGNKVIHFNDNIMTIDNEDYDATPGFMELLTKKSSNTNIIKKEDIRNYQKILICSNALYQKFDKSSKKYNSDSSDKWKFIKANYFVTKASDSQDTQGQDAQGTKQGSSISPLILPSDINSLLDSLRLSVASYQAGNSGEYNTIHAILDELIRQKKVKKKELPCVYMNIGL
uniref:Type III effector n=1 Tax=Heterorhabditis bacteriophora TaxID=37862 RepID=A0A1I7XMB8_HETBA